MKKKHGPIRAIVYMRRTHWTDHPLAQMTICENYRSNNNIKELCDFYDDGQDLTQLNIQSSPGFIEALNYCRTHKGEVDLLIVSDRSRLGLTTAEYLYCRIELLKCGVEIVSATEPADSSMEEIIEALREYDPGNGRQV